MKHRAIINKGIEIDGIKINEKIFDEEMIDYTLIEREDQIDHLINWISEAHDRPSDLYLMKEDLKMLINWDCEYIFSSISTNEYIQQDNYTPKSEFVELVKRWL